MGAGNIMPVPHFYISFTINTISKLIYYSRHTGAFLIVGRITSAEGITREGESATTLPFLIANPSILFTIATFIAITSDSDTLPHAR
jgi:hypothetical protein